MIPLTLYNTLNRRKEEFKPLKDQEVGMYTCGPTVYDYPTIGNWRTYTLGDLVYKVLKYNGYNPTYVMNVTDVGHLTGDNEGDSSSGEDRLEKGAKREGKTAWDIANFYTEDFLNSFEKINIYKPEIVRATDHIKEQIELVQKIEKEGFTYKTSDGIYFDTQAYENAGYTYGELSTLDELKEGARVEINPERKNPRDFALWKFSPTDEKRDMEWESPWGKGFPGWHIECSAMSMKYLGEQFDIHLGGEDLRTTHHPNEIAQSESVTHKHPFVTYWIHGAFLQVNGGRMGKSLGNAYSLHDIINKGYSPLALRYFYLMGHYRSQINFTWEALDASSNALNKLYERIREYGDQVEAPVEEYTRAFQEALNDDLNTSRALALVWELVKDETVSLPAKKGTLLDFDRVLGLGLDMVREYTLPDDIQKLIDARDEARAQKDWAQADTLREELSQRGYEVKDTDSGTRVYKKA